MKVSTRIIAGYGVLILFALAVLWYQVSVIQHLDEINSTLSRLNDRYAVSNVVLQYKQGLFEDSAKKYYAVGDPLYKTLFQEADKNLEEILKKLRDESISNAEVQAIDNLSASLKSVRETIESQSGKKQLRDVSPELTKQIDLVHADMELVLNATQTAIQEAATLSKKTSEHAVRVSKYVASTALLFSILVSAAIVWSIARRIRQLEKATKVVASGQFDHPMPVSGSDEFASLAKDFNAMAQKLGELDRLKKDFVSHVSHDLKGPLASTREIVHLLLEGIPGPLNEKQKRLLGLCLNSSERLSGMIGNLLDVSKMEAGMLEYQFESCDLVALVEGAVSEFEGLAHEKKIELIVEPEAADIPVECDPLRLTQVLFNLLENAIKFSPESSRITVRIQVNGAYSSVAVVDRGPGIPIESRDKVFDRFYQVSPGRKLVGQGVGLGLSICKIVVEAHGGSIWVDSNPEGGSIFQFKVRSSAKVSA
jgi:two-component system sensor histidine kinase GlrK